MTHAQNAIDFGGAGGGSVRIGNDTRTCDAGVAGTLRINGGVLQGCDGTAWRPFTMYTPTPASGYFVLVNTTYTASSIGGLSGGNSICLTRLQADTWLGKSDAQTAGQLIAAKVKAFLCDSSTCNQAVPNTVYKFAATGSSTVGGAQFTTNASGQGPGDNNNWSNSTYFSDSTSYWTNRNAGTTTLWGTTPVGSGCGGFTGSSGNARTGASATTTDSRWNNSITACGTATRIICMVHP